ncbi:MAG: hypothetical protein HC831_16870, partial [Chloroflexia bacterium]|nr:hypothetical protein [Chloroflexia bacterium]
MYAKNKPLYPFGHGLSYTKFEYSNLEIRKENSRAIVSFDVKNSGGSDGDEVVQVYVSHVGSEVERPVKELKGFSRIHVKKRRNYKSRYS